MVEHPGSFLLSCLGAGVLALALAPPARAVDGVVEINQATSGGALIIAAPGSYRLTSDLTAPPGDSAIRIMADDVTLDLNGFTIQGGGGSFADGIFFGTENVEIRNGTVRGFSRYGVFTNINAEAGRVIGIRAIGNTFTGIELQGTGMLVDGCTSLENGSYGIRVGSGSLIVNSVARSNTNAGLLAPNSGYRSNVLSENNGGNANPQVVGGANLGHNLCGSALCP